MDSDEPESSRYIHGSSPEEQHRLSLLNDILNDSCLRELDLRPGERVLDLGCGTGQFTRLLAHAVGRTGHVVGVERDPHQLAQARTLADLSGETTLVEFRRGDATALPLNDSESGAFDVAHARFLLEHVPNPASVIAEMVRAVRTGGRVFVSDDDHGSFRPWPEPRGFSALWHAYVRSYERLGNDPYVGRRLVELLRAGGLVSIRNTCVFFGGCAGNERFEAVAENLIAVLEGAREPIVSAQLLDRESFQVGIDGLRYWKADPTAALWYTVCCAEGVVPGQMPPTPPT